MKRFILSLGVFLLGAFALLAPVAAAPEIVQLQNPIGGTGKNPKGEVSLQVIVGKAIKQALGILGSITFLVFVYGGFLWLTSAGNSDQVQKGTDTMLWAAIGVCIIFASYAILNFVITSLTK